jgi:class 3 adenylate cyclase/streptogramin lyase
VPQKRDPSGSSFRSSGTVNILEKPRPLGGFEGAEDRRLSATERRVPRLHAYTRRMLWRTVGRGLGAVLFTDIVGSTAIAGEMGNSRWSELVSRHHRLIRREVRRFGGREQDTAGDGFFVTFERPVDAIRCATAAVEAVRSLGIEIRAGVSFGQLEVVEGKAGGIIVNTAARVMSVAGPGEVLVPASVVEIVSGAGIAFADHGSHRLKGLGSEVRVFLVTEADGRALPKPLAAEEAAERRVAIVPAADQRAGLLVGGFLAAVVAVVLGIWALAGADETPPRRETATASRFVVELDPETGQIGQRIDFPDVGRPETVLGSYELIAGQGALWAEQQLALTPALFRVDPEHGEVRRVRLPGSGVYSISMVASFDALWATTDRLIRVNPATDEGRPVFRIPESGVGLGGASLAADRRHLWLGTPGGTLFRFGPTGEESGRQDVADHIHLVATGEGWVWVVDQVATTVTRVDPVTLEPFEPIQLAGNIDAIAIMNDYVWALDFGTGVLTRISARAERVVGQRALPGEPTALAVGAGAVWVSHDDGTVTRVDPVTLEPAEFTRVNGSARGIAVDEARESIWVDVSRSTN